MHGDTLFERHNAYYTYISIIIVLFSTDFWGEGGGDQTLLAHRSSFSDLMPLKI